MGINWVAVIALAWIPVVAVIAAYLLIKRLNLSNAVSLVKVASVLIGGVTLAMSLSTVQRYVFSTQAYIPLNVKQFWPRTPDWMYHTTNATAQVVGGGFTQAKVVVEGLSVVSKVMLSLSSLAFATVVLLACWQAYAISREIEKGEQFKDRMPGRLTWSGVTIIVVGMLGQIANVLGTNYAAQDIFGNTSGYGWQQSQSGVGPALVSNPLVTVNGNNLSDQLVFGIVQNGAGASLEFWPMAIGLVLLVLARVFKRGEELADETEGLI